MPASNTNGGGRLLTAREAAEFLRASRAKLYRLLKAGDLAGYKVGATYVFYESELHAYVRRQLGAADDSLPVQLADGGTD
ncbi:MAG: helix-turn-helix domain-containing protein [Chloroflexota bacterium]